MSPALIAALGIIRQFEGLRLKAYPDPGTAHDPDPAKRGKPWTIGYGHTAGVKQGDTCAAAQAEAWLASDAAATEGVVRRLVLVEASENQIGALTSFAFNVGTGNLSSSTLLRLMNTGHPAQAADEFARWNKAGGAVLDGLVRRRKAERDLFVTPDGHL